MNRNQANSNGIGVISYIKMAPPKVMLKQNRAQNSNTTVVRKGMTTRSQNQNSLVNNVLNKHNISLKEIRGKRKAEASPFKEKTTKRTAFANITNVSICITSMIIGYYYIFYSYLSYFYYFYYFYFVRYIL